MTLVEFEKVFGPSYGRAESNSYPRYNIWKQGDEKFGIEIAVLGLNREDIIVYLNHGVLTVEGARVERPENLTFIEKGLSDKAFKKSFNLNRHYKVSDVLLKNGMLLITLEKDDQSKYLLDITEL